MLVSKSFRQKATVVVASAMGFAAIAGFNGRADTIRVAASGQGCPEPAVEQTATVVTPVTKANYGFAETEVILDDYVRKIAKGTCSDGVGVFFHQKTAQDPKERSILRPNFDRLYSFAVLDLNTPATVELPDTDRYQILEVVDDEHWIPLISDKPGRYTLAKESMGSRYVFAFARTQLFVRACP